MAKPNQLLATSLAELRGVTQNGTRSVVKSEELSRVHRERLQTHGFLEEIMKGWLAVNSRPSANNRIDTAWSTVYWEFIGRYLDDRFPGDWRLSAEPPLRFGPITTPSPHRRLSEVRRQTTSL
ncbi:hypothetical protein [Rhizobium binae]|uniref:hypothetical protein n=1 Tax=Rhizobium binae TaxID=1138190 RepID=UPI002180B1C4|nr:hypothetical protein [Rhizobium binae]